MDFKDLTYETDGPVVVVGMNRPQYRNAQSYGMLDELDAALDQAMADEAIKVVIVTGHGDHFSSGHDLGTPDMVEDRKRRGIPDSGLKYYDNFRRYNYDITIKWRNLPKPTVAMVRGYCIFGGWMIASAMDLVFADRSSLFLAGLVEYYSIPWDVGVRKAKELLFESRFIDADEAHALGFVNRVYDEADLERETMAYCKRVGENSALTLRMSKIATNRTQDIQGYTNAVDAAFADYLVMTQNRGVGRVEGMNRLKGVDLAIKGLQGGRYGLTPE